MDLTFLGTGGAWGLPELNCDCKICAEARHKGEKRYRTAFLLSGTKNILVDCGPDIALQLSGYHVEKIDALLITHEHGDHYIGMDEFLSFKRNLPRGTFEPIPVYLTSGSWKVISARFGYLEEMGVISIHEVEPGRAYNVGTVKVMPFKTDHGPFATGSVGYIIKSGEMEEEEFRLVYTSDFIDIPESVVDLFQPDYLIISSYWLNEPVRNRPNQMSFQRALDYIRHWKPGKETFLVHIGDGDSVPGDPANNMLKKNEPLNPLRSPVNGEPYPIPMNQEQWQDIVDRVISDRGLPHKVTVARDGMTIRL
ncbi:MAG: MBL fold metallo-hydrolase [Deltaproteobacteria bacterium]|nr:MBL fold metallo-hydrolase [Deltaproteobacteria bacterium]